MHTVELLEQALQAAEQLGYQVRQEWLGGAGGGGCEIKGRRHLFIDLGLSVPDQLYLALDVLERERATERVKMGDALGRLLLARQTQQNRAA
jgi:hypothetical protein